MLEDAFGGIRSLKFCQLCIAEDSEGTAKVSNKQVVTTLDEKSDAEEIDNVPVNDMRFFSHYTRSVHSGVVKITRLSKFEPSNPGGLLITLHVPSDIFSALPEFVQNGHRFACKPLMFTQGINEQQTLEMKMGKRKEI